MTANNSIIYIAGYGRSGSTLLTILLDAHPQLAGVGEICHLLTEWETSDRRCSCGQLYADCSFWGDLYRQVRPPAQLMKKVESVKALPGALKGNFSSSTRYYEFQRRLFAYIRHQSGKPIVVDASKTAWLAMSRPFALQYLLDEDVYLIHLVRDGLAVTEAQVLTGQNRNLEAGGTIQSGSAWRTSLGWVAANQAAEEVARRLPAERVLRIQFESLLREPEMVMKKIGEWCHLDMASVVTKLQENDKFTVGHLVAGNRLRFESTLQLKRRPTHQGGYQLWPHQRYFFRLIGGRLQQRYGYQI